MVTPNRDDLVQVRRELDRVDRVSAMTVQWRLGGLIAVLAMILSVAVVAPAAQATFPGKNGKIVFSRRTLTTWPLPGSGVGRSTTSSFVFSQATALTPEWQCSDVVVSEIYKIDNAAPNVLDTFHGPGWDMQLDLGEYLEVTVYWVNLDGLHMSRLVGPARLF